MTDHINNILAKVNKAIDFLRKLRQITAKDNANYLIKSFSSTLSWRW